MLSNQKHYRESRFLHLADKPLILDSRNHLLNGHRRYDVARTLGIDKVKVIRSKESINVLIKQFNHLTSERAVVESWNPKVKNYRNKTRTSIYIKTASR